jgi:hypothetical protein
MLFTKRANLQPRRGCGAFRFVEHWKADAIASRGGLREMPRGNGH